MGTMGLMGRKQLVAMGAVVQEFPENRARKVTQAMVTDHQSYLLAHTCITFPSAEDAAEFCRAALG